MKKIIFVLCFTLLLLGCYKKYPDDPQTMRFISVKKRLGGEWILYKIRIDGNDRSNLIYVDSLKIFSTYIFSKITGDVGAVSVKTYNGNSSFNTPNSGSLDFVLINKKDFSGIGLGIPWPYSWDTLISKRTILPYGAINDFSGNNDYWKILKLTKEEMNWTIEQNSSKYDMFFKKR